MSPSSPRGGPAAGGPDSAQSAAETSGLARANRRTFLESAAAVGIGSMLASPAREARAAETGSAAAPMPTGSDVGSLYPFIQSQAVKGEFPLSFLNGRFSDVTDWKKLARGKL